MQHKKANKTGKQPDDALRASVRKEMARPRMAKSARIGQRNLDTNGLAERPSTRMHGTADKIIPSRHRKQPGKAQIAVDRAARPHRHLRVENSLTGKHGGEMKLEKGAHLEVTVAAESKAQVAKSKKKTVNLPGVKAPNRACVLETRSAAMDDLPWWGGDQSSGHFDCVSSRAPR